MRRDGNGSLLLLADGRYALSSTTLLAVGARRQLGAWVARRITRGDNSPGERAWLEEVAGALAGAH